MPKEPDDALEGDLGSVTDDEWREQHLRLTTEFGGVFPPEELDFVWDPQLDPRDLVGPGEVDAIQREDNDA